MQICVQIGKLEFGVAVCKQTHGMWGESKLSAQLGVVWGVEPTEQFSANRATATGECSGCASSVQTLTRFAHGKYGQRLH